MKYAIQYHYDVYGNSEDGYQVNDSRSAGFVDITPEMTDMQVIRAVQAESGIVITTNDRVDGDDHMLTIDFPDGCPMFSLILEG